MQRTIVSSALRAASRSTKSSTAVRQLSSSASESDLNQMRNLSFAGLGLAGALAVYQYYVHVQHHNSGKHYDRSLNTYPYMNLRYKQFPWSCGDCTLFDQKCWDACKGRESGKH